MTASAGALAPSRLRRGATRSGLKILIDAAFTVLLLLVAAYTADQANTALA